MKTHKSNIEKAFTRVDREPFMFCMLLLSVFIIRVPNDSLKPVDLPKQWSLEGSSSPLDSDATGQENNAEEGGDCMLEILSDEVEKTNSLNANHFYNMSVGNRNDVGF
jgi:hypothetical protein